MSAGRRKHEAVRYAHRLEGEIGRHASTQDYRAAATIRVERDGTGVYLLPSAEAFSRLDPGSAPTGIVFRDGSFLIVKETFRFGYRTPRDGEPTIWRSEYSYHYQRPDDAYFFRFDCHPSLGDPATHPLHHLHSAGWREGDTKLVAVPRFSVPEMTLPEVLELIEVSFFPRDAAAAR